MKALVITAILLLAILHQDFWWWDDPTPVFGFMPVGLAWHMGISFAAGIVGLIAVKYCWPEELRIEEEKENRTAEETSGEKGDVA